MQKDQRLVIYCLLEPDAADALEDVRAHYRDADPRVEVIVDRRVRQRRRVVVPPPTPDRRGGADRRRFSVPRRLAPLPDELAERTGPVRWTQRMLPVGAPTEALSTAEIVAAVRRHDPEAPTELYWRYYQRIHSRLCVLLGNATEADASVVDAFGRVLDGLEDPERRAQEFDALLYEQVDAVADDVLGRRGELYDLPDGGLGIQDPELDEAVRLSEPDKRWAARANAERERLLELLEDHVEAIEHIGGTAVPGLPSRNTLDLMAGVRRLPLPEEAIELLEAAGYEDCGSAGTPGRQYLRRRGRTRVDLHLVEYDGALWEDALLLRDHLRRHPGDAQRWAGIKRDAARTAPTSAARYYDLRRLALDELLDRARREQLARAA